jgi:hypothetical protein
LLGGVTLGVFVGASSILFAQVEAARLAFVLTIGGVATAALVHPPLRSWLPGRSCQVPQYHVTGEPMVTVGLKWGFELGTGVCTFVVTPAFLTLLAVGLLQEPATRVIALLGLYGLVRGVTIATFSLLPAQNASDRRPPGVGLERGMRIPLLAISLIAIAEAIVLA